MSDSTAGERLGLAAITMLTAWGGSYITSGRAFDDKLKENRTAIADVRDTLNAVTTRITAQLDTAKHQLDELHAELADTREQKQQLQRDLAMIQTGVRAARVEVDHLERRATTIRDRARQGVPAE